MQRHGALRGPRSAPAALRRQADPSASPAAAPAAPVLAVGEPLLTLLPDGVATLTASGALNLWSAAAERLTGRDRAAVRRLGFAALLRDPRLAVGLVERALTRRRPVMREVTLLDAAGREVPVRLHALALGPATPRAALAARADAAGDPDVALLVLEDLSEVHTIRRRLIETEKLSAMAKIAGSVAHEFRNPLNSLFLSADLLEDELADSKGLGETIAPTLAAIREEIERLNQIITHYLALSKVVSGERVRVDLAQLVADFVEAWRAKAADRGVALKLRSEESGCHVEGDINQLRRVLVNLVENALDAVQAPRRGTVTLSVRRARRNVCLSVGDDGEGIPPGIRARVFEPFTTTKAGGTGLGLYLVREMVLAHGGTIRLLSEPGRGTRVTLRLPASATARRRPTEPAP